MNFDFDDIVEEVVNNLVETVDTLEDDDPNNAVSYEMGIGFYLMSPFSDQGAIPLWTIHDTFFKPLEHYLWSIVGRMNVGRPFAYSADKFIADNYHINYIEDVVISAHIYIIHVIIPLRTKLPNIESVFQFFEIAETLRKKWRHEEFIPNGHVIIPTQGTWTYSKNIDVQAMWPCTKKEGDQNIWIKHKCANAMSDFSHHYDVIRVSTRHYNNLADRVIKRSKFDYVEYVTKFLKDEIKRRIAKVTNYNHLYIDFTMQCQSKGAHFSCVSPLIEDANKVLCYHHLSVSVFRLGDDGEKYIGTNPMTYLFHEFMKAYDSLYHAILQSELRVAEMRLESAVKSEYAIITGKDTKNVKTPLGHELLTIICRPHYSYEIKREVIVVIQTTVPDKMLLYHAIPNLINDISMECQFMLHCSPEQTLVQNWFNNKKIQPNG